MREEPAGQTKFPFLWYALAAAAVLLILAWGVAEKGPSHWDDSWYLAAAVRLFDKFGEQGLSAYWNGFRYALPDKAPLITVLPFPFFCLLGRSVFVVYLVSAVACVALAAGLYRLCRKFFGQTVSLLSVFLALSSPLLAGLSRIFLPEYWLTVLVVLAMLALAEWDDTERDRWLVWLGALCGLGLLMKITFPAFAAPAIAVVLWRKHGNRAGRLLLDVVLIGVPLLALAGPWYVHNWEAVMHRSFQETYFTPVHPTAKPSPLAMAADYFLIHVNNSWSVIHVLAGVAGLVAWLDTRRDNFLGRAIYYVVPWLVMLPVFALSENRDLRLIAPMFPAFAIVTAALFARALERWRRARAWMLAGVVAGGVLVTLGNSFEVFGPRTLQLGPWQVFSYAQGYSFAPNPQRWPLDKVLELLARRERLQPGSKLIVGLGADTWSFNTNNLDLEAALLKYPFEFHTTAYTASTEQIHRIMSATQYFLFKQGGTQQPLDQFRSGARTLDYLAKGPLFHEVPPGVETPDGGRIEIFENASAGPDVFYPARQPGAAAQLDQADVNLGNYLQITGLRLAEKQGVFTLQLRWRCLNPVPVAYRCFAHIVNAQERPLGSMDHEILHGSPPVNEWQPGDEGYEARYLALPPATARNAHLQIGIFDLESGLRVPVWTSTFPLRDDYTAAVVDPAQPPPAGYRFEAGPAPLTACNVVFENGLRLTGYSLRRAGEVMWVRLRWEAPRRLSKRLRFFGHAVADQSRDTPILLSFDQDLGLEKMPAPPRGSPIEATEDIVRDAAKLGAQAKFLRAGVFDVDQPLDRLSVRTSSVTLSRQQKAIYLPLPPPAGAQ
ncbi:MAG TPA: glycosyltransferase family 39 protein [Bryobacterales bacterium]|nr:glycosyltransferase family 39 protein [Bryobacterales bacterium]